MFNYSEGSNNDQGKSQTIKNTMDQQDNKDNSYTDRIGTTYRLLSLKECQKPMQRMVVLDTETTGLDFTGGHRMTEIGCVELYNNKMTGKFFQTYINPCRDVSVGAYRVTGLSRDFLQDKPLFRDIAQEFLNFLGDSPLIIHNAVFDVPFLNHELRMAKFPEITLPVLDTLVVAREMFAGKPCNLDALCRRLNIDNSTRSFHGALLDAQILSKVYMGLLTSKKSQNTLEMFLMEESVEETSDNITKINRNIISKQLVHESDLILHQSYWE